MRRRSLSFWSRESKNAAKCLFLLGLTSSTQINLVGMLGISEFVMLICAPILFFKDYLLYHRDRSTLFFNLLLLWVCGAVLADFVNHSYFEQFARGISTPVVTLANCICLYHLLRKDILNFKWFLIGIAISGVISIFVFQPGTAQAEGMDAVDAIVGYKLFWGGQLRTWLGLPVRCFYLATPFLYSVLAVMLFAGYELLTGGRSNFIMMMASLLLILLGGRTGQSQRKIKRMFILIAVIMIMGAVASKAVYKYAVTHGMLGEEEQRKYEMQTKAGSDALTMLMNGRVEFFVCFYAVLDRPFIGLGSHALDYNGYYLEFMRKYGDYDEYVKMTRQLASMGNPLTKLPAHSHIATYYAWHGIFALLFWGYTIYLVFMTLKKRMAVVPELYGFLALSLPMYIWHVLFSPYGTRPEKCFMFVILLLLARIEREQRLNIRVGGKMAL